MITRRRSKQWGGGTAASHNGSTRSCASVILPPKAIGTGTRPSLSGGGGEEEEYAARSQGRAQQGRENEASRRLSRRASSEGLGDGKEHAVTRRTELRR